MYNLTTIYLQDSTLVQDKLRLKWEMVSFNNQPFFIMKKEYLDYFCAAEQCEVNLKVITKGWQFTEFVVNWVFYNEDWVGNIETIDYGQVGNYFLVSLDNNGFKKYQFVNFEYQKEGIKINVIPLIDDIEAWVHFEGCSKYKDITIILNKNETLQFDVIIKKEVLDVLIQQKCRIYFNFKGKNSSPMYLKIDRSYSKGLNYLNSGMTSSIVEVQDNNNNNNNVSHIPPSNFYLRFENKDTELSGGRIKIEQVNKHASDIGEYDMTVISCDLKVSKGNECKITEEENKNITLLADNPNYNRQKNTNPEINFNFWCSKSQQVILTPQKFIQKYKQNITCDHYVIIGSYLKPEKLSQFFVNFQSLNSCTELFIDQIKDFQLASNHLSKYQLALQLSMVR